MIDQKVCYIVSVQEKFGGLRTFNIGLVEALSKKIRKAGGQFYLLLHQKYKNDFIHIKHINFKYFKMHRLAFENIFLKKYVNSISPDFIIFPNNRVPFIFKYRNVSVIIHDLQFWRYPENYSIFKYFFRKIAIRNAIQKSDKIFSISEFTKNELIDYGCRKNITVINEGFNPVRGVKTETIRPIIKALKIHNYFFFLGSKSKHKNLVNLIEAFSTFNTNKNYFLVLAGSHTNNKENYLKSIKNSSQKSKIIDLVEVNDSEKDFLYKNCFSFVFPSSYEGFGLPVLESWSYKKLIIAANKGNLKFLVKGAGILQGISMSEILIGLQESVENKEKNEKYIEEGTKRLKKYTWIQTASLLLKNIR